MVYNLSLSLSSDYGYAREDLTGPCVRDADVSFPDPCAEGKPNYTVSSGCVVHLIHAMLPRAVSHSHSTYICILSDYSGVAD